jgi:hypothetical protein
MALQFVASYSGGQHIHTPSLRFLFLAIPYPIFSPGSILSSLFPFLHSSSHFTSPCLTTGPRNPPITHGQKPRRVHTSFSMFIMYPSLAFTPWILILSGPFLPPILPSLPFPTTITFLSALKSASHARSKLSPSTRTPPSRSLAFSHIHKISEY